MQAPKAKKIDKILEIHNDKRVDPYYWLNEREEGDVIEYLEAENAFTKYQLKETDGLQESLFKEIVGRIKEDDESVPYKKNGYWYYSRYAKGKEHPIHCRKKESLDNAEEIMLDVNELAQGHSFYQIAGMSVSPDNKWLAFGEDTLSRRIYTIRIKDLTTGEILDIEIPNTSGGAAWANDNNTLFYSERDTQTLRTFRVNRYDLSSRTIDTVYEEKDNTFYCHASKSKSNEYIVIESDSTLTTEVWVLAADDPKGEFTCFQPRVRGMEFSISHYADKWYILTNWNATNFKLMTTPLNETERENWVDLIPHREETLVEGIEIFKNYLVVEERTNGLTHLRVMNHQDSTDYYIPFDDEAYTCWTSINPDFDSEVLRYGYSSLTTPISTIDYNMSTKHSELLKQQEVVGGYDRNEYTSKRLMIAARDGVKVPVSLVYKKDLFRGNNPMLLYGYGSYGHSIDPYFSSIRLSLLNRGFVYAIAHIRGGEELGRKWYDTGKMLNKKNTFNDFIDCAEGLLNTEYATEGKLYAMGGSAGGLLMGAVVNMRPDLWNGVIAAVPFVDVVTTMLDESIPLTTGEYDEWGNPNEEEYYHYIKSYSPYDNIEEKEYPNMLVTTGLHDSQVQYWEPAKWVAKLRELKTDNNLLLLYTNMETGHSGASGRFEVHRETAMEYAFFLMLEGIND